MRTLSTTLFVLTFSHLALAAPAVKRAKSAPMYGDSGKPSRFDIGQHMADCGFASALGAVADANPAWISDQISFSGDWKDVASAKVTTWDNKTLEVGTHTVDYEDMPPATDNKGAAWWPWAIAGAAIMDGTKSWPDGTMWSQLPSDALEIITGKPAKWQATAPFWDAAIALSQDPAWTVLKSARDKKSPVVLQTSGTAATLVHSHAYDVVSFVEGQTITLYNPWGTDGTYDWAKVWPDVVALAWLEGFPSYTAPATAGEVKAVVSDEGSKPATTTSSPSPQPTTSAATSANVLVASETSKANVVVVTEFKTEWVTVSPSPTAAGAVGMVALAENDGTDDDLEDCEDDDDEEGGFVVLSVPSTATSTGVGGVKLAQQTDAAAEQDEDDDCDEEEDDGAVASSQA